MDARSQNQRIIIYSGLLLALLIALIFITGFFFAGR